MKKLLLIILLNLFLGSANSQVIDLRSIDSLRNILAITKEDTNKVKLLADYSFYVVFTAPDQALSFAQEGLVLARSIDYLKGQALCNAVSGFTWWITGDHEEAINIFLRSLKQAETLKDRTLLERSLDGLVSSYRDQGNYEEALRYVRRARNVTSSDNSFWKVMMGSVYNAMDKPDSALYYMMPVDPGFSPSFFGYTLFEIGKAYQKMGNIEQAIQYYKKSVETLSKSTNIKDLALAYNGIASLFSREGNPDSCIFYAKRGLEITQRLSYKKGAYESYLLLSSAYEPSDKAEALKYYKLAMEARDNIFNTMKQAQGINARFTEQLQQIELEKEILRSQNQIRTAIFTSVIGVSIIVTLLLYRNIRQKQKAKNKIEMAYGELKATQQQLIQREKMASLGELTAGIAHEIENPLNFVNNFSEVNEELMTEMKEQIRKGKIDDAIALANDAIENQKKINHHGKRADAIVKGMMQHSHGSNGIKEPTDINKLAGEYLRLAYHACLSGRQGLHAKEKSLSAEQAGFTVSSETDFDESIRTINIIRQDIGQVLLNLYNNAFYAVLEKKKTAGNDYEPTVSVSTKAANGKVIISVRDNGNGIPQKNLDKIFQPFFTTKPTGEGTGLGLSLSYDIISKGHGGEMKVETREGEGTIFIIQLPAN